MVRRLLAGRAGAEDCMFAKCLQGEEPPGSFVLYRLSYNISATTLLVSIL